MLFMALLGAAGMAWGGVRAHPGTPGRKGDRPTGRSLRGGNDQLRFADLGASRFELYTTSHG